MSDAIGELDRSRCVFTCAAPECSFRGEAVGATDIARAVREADLHAFTLSHSIRIEGTFAWPPVSGGAQLRPGPEGCQWMGGHCFERTGFVLGSRGDQYEERCKHCGQGRVAIPREPWEYRDA